MSFADEKKPDVYGNEAVEASDDVSDIIEYSEAEQKKIIHRIDRRLVIITGVIYCISIIDRSNIGSAAVAGMPKDLGMNTQNNAYSIATLMFFVSYIFFETPGVVGCRKFGPRIFLPIICLLWGACVTCMGLVKTWQQLLGMRLILGALEAGYFPGASYLLSTWYNRYELGRRFAAFYVIGSIANAFTGIMAYGLMQMNGVGGLAGWRWIFIIEGLLTCVIAVLGYIFIPPFPDDPNAHKTWGFLNRSEVNYVIRKVEADRGDTQLEPFTLGRFFQGGKDWKCYAFGMMICMCTIPAYALAFFLPLILNQGMGYSVAKAQLMTAPPYLIQAVYQFAFGYVSDNYKARGPFIIFNCVLETIGLAVMGWAPNVGARYFGVIMTCCGMAANLPLVFTYQSNNVRGQWKRAFSSTIMVSMAAVGGIIGSLVFRPQDAPSYRPGLYTCFTGAVLTLLLTSFFIVYFKWANKKADRGEKVLEGSESFRYTI
ncbi:hypothetical protein TWF569_002246 [Orbilia oligospora]|uniref:Major facilitator superfamily (MFS) profile domain-containing protein n=1 Tax=Orbilia oligospora TaxID=2813651 RepID=A0A7C8J1T5_ORBOL|nr:hypothetical protein TWF706_002315 [Orbilia oligospora]KAF3088341.1 hypothetical protein TWF102_010241 [Orbilia oligospora]KAF3095087.1 hypothetical protein TWF103_010372 [Orbilia oligospora]KAF3122161.1 hypothetical protein TWF569_002246 [Orbilia oligospora]KAF3127799.1 hypothetical protein TWF703_009847 [Orbilia oligospora]